METWTLNQMVMIGLTGKRTLSERSGYQKHGNKSAASWCQPGLGHGGLLRRTPASSVSQRVHLSGAATVALSFTFVVSAPTPSTQTSIFFTHLCCGRYLSKLCVALPNFLLHACDISNSHHIQYALSVDWKRKICMCRFHGKYLTSGNSADVPRCISAT